MLTPKTSYCADTKCLQTKSNNEKNNINSPITFQLFNSIVKHKPYITMMLMDHIILCIGFETGQHNSKKYVLMNELKLTKTRNTVSKLTKRRIPLLFKEG